MQPDRDFGRWPVRNVETAAEDGVGDDEHDESTHHVDCRIRHPEDTKQAHVFSNPAAPKLDQTNHGFTAASAARLSRLQLHSTLIAKHRNSSAAQTVPCSEYGFDPPGVSWIRRLGPVFRSRSRPLGQLRSRARTSSKTKRPPGNLGSLFFQGRIVPTEVLSIRTFCRDLMSLKSAVSSKICDLNSPIFNNLQRASTSQQTRSKSVKMPSFRC